MENNVSVIMYHYVRDLKNSRFPDIKGLDTKLFEAQIKYLTANCTVISMDTLVNCMQEGSQLPANSVLLTFDDGYSDHFVNVLPILLKHGIQGCFYPPAKAILNREVLDVNKIHFILASVENKSVLVEEVLERVGHYREAYRLNSNEQYFAKHAIASRYDTAEVMFIKYMLQVVLQEDLRLIICNYLFKKYVTNDEASFSEQLYMNVEKIRELRAEGMHIGSHSYDHYWLGSLSKEKQETEINKSLDFLKLTGCDLHNWTMCYPYGNYNQDTLDILENTGCKLALTTKVGVANLSLHKKLELPRIDTNEIPTVETTNVIKS